MGSFSMDLPGGYFDVLSSISVVEHVPLKDFENFFKDMAGIMKTGGTMYHALIFTLEMNLPKKQIIDWIPWKH